METIEKQMQENSSIIYWQISDIDDNLMHIAKELLGLDISRRAMEEIGGIIKEYLRAIDFVRSQSLEVCEEFAIFIVEPGVTRFKVEDEDIMTRLARINAVLADQAGKMNYFISSIESREEDIPEPTPILFYESGTSMLKAKNRIIESSNFIAFNLKKYDNYINSKKLTRQ